MSKSFTLCKIESFPTRKYIRIENQLKLEFDDIERDPLTEITLQNKNFYQNFDAYRCHHELMHNKHGYVHGKFFNRYLEPYNFTIYLNRDKELLIIAANKNISNDFIDICNKNINEFICERLMVDYNKISPILPQINGAWFADLNSSFVRKAAYFGSNVDKDQRFITAAKEGIISSLNLNYILKGKENAISITKDGTIVLRNSYNEVYDELYVVLSAYDEFINI